VPMIGEVRATLLLLLIICSLIVFFPNVEAVVAAEPWVQPELPSDFQPGQENWVEVTSFTKESVPSTWWGDPSGNTDYFNCTRVEWRIRWEYTPHPAVPQYASFYVEVYEKKEDVIWRGELIHEGESVLVDVFEEFGMSETSGVSYIHNQTGRFYLSIRASNIEDFTIIVEQDIESIPEFPSWAPLLIALVAVVAMTFVYRHKLRKQSRRRFGVA
jgi:hypothetical protein